MSHGILLKDYTSNRRQHRAHRKMLRRLRELNAETLTAQLGESRYRRRVRPGAHQGGRSGDRAMSALDVDWLSLWAGFMLVAGVGAGWISRALIAERRAKASGPEETPAEPISTPESAAVGSGSREGDAAPPARLMVTPGIERHEHPEARGCVVWGCTPVEVSTDA